MKTIQSNIYLYIYLILSYSLLEIPTIYMSILLEYIIYYNLYFYILYIFTRRTFQNSPLELLACIQHRHIFLNGTEQLECSDESA